MGTLTVRENIAFSAALRLSSEYNWNDRKDKVNQILEELALTEVADSKVCSYSITIYLPDGGQNNLYAAVTDWDRVC